MKKHIVLPSYLKLSQVTIGIVAFFYVIYIGQEIIIPIVFALLISILLNPFVEFLQAKRINHVVSILIVVLVATVIILLLFYLLISQASIFAEALPQLKIKFNTLFESVINWLSTTFNTSDTKIHEWIVKQKGEGLSSSPAIVGKTLMSLSSVLFKAFLIPVYVFMFLFYKNLLIRFISSLFLPDKNGVVKEILKEVKNLIQNYLYGLCIEAIIVSVLNAVVLLIIGVDYAILIGIIGGLLNVIPYIGGIIAIALPMILAVATQSPTAALWVFGGYLIVQFIDNHYIVPYIVASKVKINGLISIIVVLVGGAFWGVAGMFLAIPLTAILKVIFDRVKALKPWGILLGDDL